jgi:hypothetical protein
MDAKLMNINAQCPAESFRKTFTDYLGVLPSSTMKHKGTVMMEIWCCPTKTGIIGYHICGFAGKVFYGLLWAHSGH